MVMAARLSNPDAVAPEVVVVAGAGHALAAAQRKTRKPSLALNIVRNIPEASRWYQGVPGIFLA